MQKPITLGKGMFLAVLVCVFASFLLSQSRQDTMRQEKQSFVGPGRYQVVFSPNARADTFMIDTESGKTWQFVTFTDIEGDPHVWKPVVRVDSDSDLSAWVSRQTLKKQPQ